MAKLVRAISDMGGVVISVIDSTDIVKRMEEIQHLLQYLAYFLDSLQLPVMPLLVKRSNEIIENN